MRIAYATNDEMNHALAVGLARPLGAAVTPFRPEQGSPPGRFDALLYDLDRVPAADRPSLIRGLLSGRPPRPTAVHGYALTEEQAAAFRRHGVAVAPCLHFELIRAVCQAAADLDAAPPDDAPTDLTWINLDN